MDTDRRPATLSEELPPEVRAFVPEQLWDIPFDDFIAVFKSLARGTGRHDQ